jgi:hypothetical protein
MKQRTQTKSLTHFGIDGAISLLLYVDGVTYEHRRCPDDNDLFINVGGYVQIWWVPNKATIREQDMLDESWLENR